MKRISMVVVLAVSLSTVGCSCFRRRAEPVAAAPAPMAVCPPGTVPAYGGAATYGMPATTYVPGGY